MRLWLVLLLAASSAPAPAAMAASPAAKPASPARPGIVAAARNAWRARGTLHRLQHAARANPADGDLAAQLARARRCYEKSRGTLKHRVCQAPLVQLLKGAFVDGPKDLTVAAKAHPWRTCAIVLGAVGICTVASAAGLPIDVIALGGSGLLTAETVRRRWPEVRAAFRRHQATRWETAGEDIVFPVAAFAAGTGLGLAVEEAAGLADSGAGGALTQGLKSTAQTVDDLVPLVETVDGQPEAATGSATREGVPLAPGHTRHGR